MPTRDALKLALTIALVAFVPGATAPDQAAAIGKQRAIDSTIEWEVRDAGHPALGNIRFAYIKRPVETKAGSAQPPPRSNGKSVKRATLPSATSASAT